MASTATTRDALRPISLAAFLPQFHRVAENDAWWGEGFTEWTQLRRAKSWKAGHAVRRPAASIGEYDLTDPAALARQYAVADAYGITGFAVWHYWFGRGAKLLERPLDIVLRDRIRFRYCLAWANHSWFDRARNKLLMRQEYLGVEDYTAFFDDSLRHFVTDNYTKSLRA